MNLEKFLTRNESCTWLQLADCKLRSPAMVFLGLGLSKNVTLERLNLAENIFSDRESIQELVRNLLENWEASKLIDIDMQKN